MSANYSLGDLFAAREKAWADVPACAAHYPKPCECEFVPPVVACTDNQPQEQP